MRLPAASIRALFSICALALVAACSGGGPSSVANLPVANQPAAAASIGSDVTADKCVTTGGVQVLPCHLKFTAAGSQTQVTVSGQGVTHETWDKACNSYITKSYFDYGIWFVTSKAKPGKCSTVISAYDGSNNLVGTATLVVKNKF